VEEQCTCRLLCLSISHLSLTHIFSSASAYYLTSLPPTTTLPPLHFSSLPCRHKQLSHTISSYNLPASFFLIYYTCIPAGALLCTTSSSAAACHIILSPPYACSAYTAHICLHSCPHVHLLLLSATGTAFRHILPAAADSLPLRDACLYYTPTVLPVLYTILPFHTCSTYTTLHTHTCLPVTPALTCFCLLFCITFCL